MPLLALAWLAACGAPSPDAPIVARYDGGVVDRTELASWLAFKGVEDDPELRLAYAEKIALTEACAARALQAGHDRIPSVRLQLEALERGVLTRALRRFVADETTVPDEEVERLLAAGRDRLVRPEKVRLRNIFKEVPAAAAPEERESVRLEMEALRERLLAGEDFGGLAEEESDSLSRHRGGRLGAIVPGQLRPEIEAVARTLEPGEVSEVIETAEGFTVLRCDAIVEARTLSDDEARERIRVFQHRRRVESAWRQLRDELVSAAGPSYDLALVRDPQTPPETVVARVAGRDVTLRELERQLRARRVAGPPHEASEDSLRAAVEELAFLELASARARELGLAERPEVVEHLSWVRSEALLTEEVRQRLEEEFVPPSEAELRAYFEANRRSLRGSPRYDLSVIRLPVDPAAPRQEAEQAEAILSRLRSGQTTFAQAAREHSQHPSAESGGRLGWVPRRRVATLGPAVLRTVSGLQPGESSDVVLQDRNLWILALHAVEPAVEPSFEEAAPTVERRLGTRRGNELSAEIEERLIAELGVRLADGAQRD